MIDRRWVLVCLPAVLATACTSFSGLPREGTGSKFNLATVDYVESREAAIAERVTSDVSSKLPAILDEAIADERARLAALETALVAQQSQMALLAASMDETEQNVAQLSDEIRLRVADLEISNNELRMMTGSLSSDVEALPSDTLRQLSAALSAHLTPTPDVAAGPPPSPAPAPEPAPVREAAAEPIPSEFIDTPVESAP